MDEYLKDITALSLVVVSIMWDLIKLMVFNFQGSRVLLQLGFRIGFLSINMGLCLSKVSVSSKHSGFCSGLAFKEWIQPGNMIWNVLWVFYYDLINVHGPCRINMTTILIIMLTLLVLMYVSLLPRKAGTRSYQKLVEMERLWVFHHIFFWKQNEQ